MYVVQRERQLHEPRETGSSLIDAVWQLYF